MEERETEKDMQEAGWEESVRLKVNGRKGD